VRLDFLIDAIVSNIIINYSSLIAIKMIKNVYMRQQ